MLVLRLAQRPSIEIQDDSGESYVVTPVRRGASNCSGCSLLEMDNMSYSGVCSKQLKCIGALCTHYRILRSPTQ
jgi:hypothetical protein